MTLNAGHRLFRAREHVLQNVNNQRYFLLLLRVLQNPFETFTRVLRVSRVAVLAKRHVIGTGDARVWLSR